MYDTIIIGIPINLKSTRLINEISIKIYRGILSLNKKFLNLNESSLIGAFKSHVLKIVIAIKNHLLRTNSLIESLS